jgi:hypothetical protein
VKDFVTNSNEAVSSTTQSSNQYARNLTVQLGLPNTVLSYLSSRPLGSSLNDRVRVGQSVNNSQSQRQLGSVASDASTWLGLLSDPLAITVILVTLAVVFYAGPVLLPLLGKALGVLINGIFTATSSVVKGAGAAAGAIIQETGQVVASAENLVSKSINADAANTASRYAAANASNNA